MPPTSPFNITWVQGTGDNYYKQGQLLPENFLKASREAGHDEFQVRVRSQSGYDHSYYFVSTPHYGLNWNPWRHKIDFDIRLRPHSL